LSRSIKLEKTLQTEKLGHIGLNQSWRPKADSFGQGKQATLLAIKQAGYV